MSEVYKLVQRRTALADPAVVETLRDLLAVHWVRSPALRDTRERIRDRVKADSVRKLASRPDLVERGMMQKLGLVPGSSADLDWFNHRLHDEVMEAMSEQMHSDSLGKNYETAREILSKWHVQIAYSERADFLIGDAPVITIKPNHYGVGPHQGVALGDSTQVMMPISPRVLIAMGPEPGFRTVGSEFVEECNVYQLRGFTRWLGCQPGGPSDQAMRRHIPVRSL